MVKLDKAVSSSDKPGTKFSGVLQGDLGTNGAVKTGSAVIGEVAESKKAKRVRGKAEVTFALTQVNINGQLVPITTEPIQDIAASSTKKTAKGAAKGAAVGAVVDGGDGAAKGAAIGASASALKKGESAGNDAGDVGGVQIGRAADSHSEMMLKKVIAMMAAFLASPDSGWITGETFVVAGGYR